MSDAFWTAMAIIVPSGVSGLVGIVLAVLANRTKNAVEKSGTDAVEAAGHASKKAEEVSAKLDVSGVSTDTQLNKIEGLVNGGVEKSLRIAAIALRRAAEATGEDGDRAAAEAAEVELSAHIKAQVKVDVAHKEAKDALAASTQTLGDVARETMGDVKEVKKDVKDIKNSS